jgi:hypothetical protein
MVPGNEWHPGGIWPCFRILKIRTQIRIFERDMDQLV